MSDEQDWFVSVQRYQQAGCFFPDDVTSRSWPGRLLFVNGVLTYEDEKKIQHTFSRYLVGKKIGRTLDRSELVRFFNSNNRDFRYENLDLKSRQASARQKYELNGQPLLGYTHCLCKCGGALDVEMQKESPHSFLSGHSPADKRTESDRQPKKTGSITPKKVRKGKRTPPKADQRKVQKAALPLQKKQPEVHFKDQQSILVLPDGSEMYDLKRYRPIFEDYLLHLEWEEFVQVIDYAMKIRPVNSEGPKK